MIGVLLIILYYYAFSALLSDSPYFDLLVADYVPNAFKTSLCQVRYITQPRNLVLQITRIYESSISGWETRPCCYLLARVKGAM